MLTLQEIICRLNEFWAAQGCALHHGHDVEVGAATFNPATFFRCLGPEPYRAAYVEPSRRPQDGRYGENPNRMQYFHQYQVILKPSPPDIQETYLRSLEAIGYDLSKHDIRFIHDDWEQPSLGAWGLGWEVWRDGMEVTQYTYFQAVGGIECRPVTVELAYGLERLAMDLLGVDNVYDLMWNETLTYGDIFQRNEVEWSRYNFEQADTGMWSRHFEGYRQEAERLLSLRLPIPAYDFLMKACHAFNILDARGVISVTERTGYIATIRDLSRRTAESYLLGREELGYPLLQRKWPSQPVKQEGSVSHPAAPFDPEKRTTLLLEIGSEEIPATFVPIGAANLKRDLEKLLKEAGIVYTSVEVEGTPRRLAAIVRGIAEGIAASEEERRGPPVAAAFDAQGEPTQVGRGFFQSLGIEPMKHNDLKDGVSIRELKGRDYLFAQVASPSHSTASLLAERLPGLILGLDFPKKMRWGSLEQTYARPLHWIVALLGNSVVPFEVGPIQSGRTSQGHRQLCNTPFEIESAEDYVERCRSHKVMVSIQERTDSIAKQLNQIEEQLNAAAVRIDRVLPLVVHMVEWPTLVAGEFSSAFLKVPKEVLISEMVEHQKYFPLVNGAGELLPHFVITSDTKPTKEVVAGNRKVLSARLSDGVFLYEQDLMTPLESLNDKLKAITFRTGLGSLRDKADRLVAYVQELHSYFPTASLKDAQRAALLCKADLASELVGEFPELQGVIGGKYALAHGENATVALAIEEHYMPNGERAPLPESGEGRLVSLADKIDNLLSCFALGLKPTSSGDPYALRRQVLGIVRILIQSQSHLPLPEALERCYRVFIGMSGLQQSDQVIEEILAFIFNRIKTVFEEYDLSKDETEAALSRGIHDIYDSYLRVRYLHDFRRTPSFFPMAEAYTRTQGVAGGERRSFSHKLLEEPAEKQLYMALEEAESLIREAIDRRRYDQAYGHLAKLQSPLAQFWNQVKVVADDPGLRENRIALLQRLLALFEQLLDFSQLKL
jgi:glycyl-tRNA synthetase